MSVVAAIRERDVSQLPGKRDEDWRWTDLRGLIRQAPEPSGEVDAAAIGVGPLDALAEDTIVVANGHGGAHIGVEPGETKVVALRIVSRGDGGHAARVSVDVEARGRLVLLETYEGDAGGYLSQTGLLISLGQEASVERIVLADDGADGVTVSQAQVELAPGAAFAQTVLTSGARRQRVETVVRHPGGHASR